MARLIKPGALSANLALVSLSTLLAACSGGDRVAGGNSSETPNTLAGRLVDQAGNPLVGDTIDIRPADWTSRLVPPGGVDRKWSTVADSSGRWTISGIASGAWVVRSRGIGRGWISDVVAVGRLAPSADLGTDTAAALLEVSGRVVSDTGALPSDLGVHVLGSDLFAPVASDGSFRFRAVPHGSRIRLLAAAVSRSARAVDEFRLPVQGLAAARQLSLVGFEDEDYSRWPVLRKARIRFSPAGWHLDSDIPRVPIRVTIDGAVLPGPWPSTGDGIRFGDSSGHKFPYEIESWDPVARKAEVWVRLDTANKGSDAHYLWLHAGRDDVPGRSDGSAVFDTAQGWLGVWHLSGPDPFRDATANGLRLSAATRSQIPAAIGEGLAVSPSTRIEVGGVPLQGLQDASVSLWVRPDSLRGQAVFARLGTEDSADWTLGGDVDTAGPRVWFRSLGQLREGRDPDRLTLVAGAWNSIGGAVSTGIPRIRTVRDDLAWVQQFADSFPVRPEPRTFSVGGGFFGAIDEIRLWRKSLHPAQIRMQWGADRDDSPVLEWLP